MTPEDLKLLNSRLRQALEVLRNAARFLREALAGMAEAFARIGRALIEMCHLDWYARRYRHLGFSEREDWPHNAEEGTRMVEAMAFHLREQPTVPAQEDVVWMAGRLTEFPAETLCSSITMTRSAPYQSRLSAPGAIEPPPEIKKLFDEEPVPDEPEMRTPPVPMKRLLELN